MDKPRRDLVLERAHAFAHEVYAVSRRLPGYERFGLTSQLKRSALSVPLNIVEGYARQSKRSEAQFLTVAYGSLKEAQYILEFAVEEKYLTPDDVVNAELHVNQAGKLIWSKTQTLRGQFQNAK